MKTDIDSSALKIFWSTRKSLVMAMMLILGGLVLVSAVVVPQVQQSMKLYRDMKKEEPKLEKLKQKLASLDQIQFSPEYAQIATVEDALPSKKPLLELMVGLSQVSQETGAIVSEFHLSPGLVATDSTQLSTTKADYDQLQLDLVVEGTFKQIQDFLIGVERVSPFTTIVSMEIGNQINTNTDQFIQDGENAIFSAKLKTETYFYTQPIQSRIDSPLPVLSANELDVLSALTSFKPTELPEQTDIRGGGLQDLFQLNPTQLQENTAQ